MKLVKLSDSCYVNPKHVLYVILNKYPKDKSYITKLKLKARYSELTWEHTNEVDAEAFYNKIINILLKDESNSSNG